MAVVGGGGAGLAVLDQDIEVGAGGGVCRDFMKKIFQKAKKFKILSFFRDNLEIRVLSCS
jgi:hypothetical protein